ncbi:MAG: hypothetical protein AAF495_24455 [Pseudomonadota bacterium]
MKINESDLLAYVDGRLKPDERRAVEEALRDDPEAQDLVARLTAVSAEEIKAALGREPADPLPLSLARQIKTASVAPPPARAPSYSPRMAIAASLLALLVGAAGGYLFAGQSAQGPVMAEASKSWLVQVAEYQKLYIRDTVNATHLDADQLAEMEARLSGRLGRDISPPDLESYGLTFKRGQILDVDGKAVAQLVYLPEAGKPIALCVIATDKGDLAPAEGHAEGLNFSHWRDKGFAFILIGEARPEQLRAMAEDAREQLQS